MHEPCLTPRWGRSLLLLVLGLLAVTARPAVAERTTADLSGPGWRLWRDEAAAWKDDTLFLPPVDLARVPANPPTGGWQRLSPASGIPVSVPGTAEEYLQAGNGPGEDVQGVTWWWRTVRVPASRTPKRVVLQFEAARLRAEVYWDRRLVGYDLVGNTPFSVDLTKFAKPGSTHRLAVRITDPGGNFAWQDFESFGWGRYRLPASHGFGGITGRVKLLAFDAVSVDDIYVANRPDPRTAEAHVTLLNATGKPLRGTLNVRVAGKADGKAVFSTARPVSLVPGRTTVRVPIAAPAARLWDIQHPNLYACTATIAAGNLRDSDHRTFGFRWFTMSGVGKDAVFRLNGKRIVLRSAISWGFWPVNGIFPTPELAAKQVRVAKSLGLNMLNFHRAIGQPIVLDEADRQGLLYYEEPGGYASYEPGGEEGKRVRDPFMAALSREKILRMVRRDRSHPSMAIFSMINETREPPDDRVKTDMRDAHAIDPSRIILYTSGWTEKDRPMPDKLHMRPYDTAQYTLGWLDEHAAPGPEVYYDAFYQGPEEIIKGTGGNLVPKATRKEINFWGEEGAISTPDRLDLIAARIRRQPRPGWDSGVYLGWREAMRDFLDRKNLRKAFPSVEALTTEMGKVSHYYQGRMIESVRMHDVTDAYVVNGWESEIMENYSGIVDCYRNPKADPSLMAYYNQPLYVAVKARDKVAQAPDEIIVDFWAVNEKGLHGTYTLEVVARDPSGRDSLVTTVPVTLTGGERYGELLREGVRVPIGLVPGPWTVLARLRDARGNMRAWGRDDILAVDWKSDAITGQGAVYEVEPRVERFLKEGKGLDVPAYSPDAGKLDWLVLAGPREAKDMPGVPIPADRVTGPDGHGRGFSATFFRGTDLKEEAGGRVDPTIDFPDGVPALEGMGANNFSVRWEGRIVTPATGAYTFRATADDGMRVWVNGQQLINDWSENPPRTREGKIDLVAGEPADVKVEFFQAGGGSTMRLLWLPPDTPTLDAGKVWDRVRDDGTTAIVVDHADSWIASLAERGAVKYGGTMRVGIMWLGGQYFVKDHPLFAGLPVNVAMNWPYQDLLGGGWDRYALKVEGEELVAGAWNSSPFSLGTAVGVIPYGKGKVIFCTLPVVDALNATDKAAAVPKKLMMNFLEAR